MGLDENFDGDAEDIEKGDFVSYKYLSETPTENLPVDPKISFFFFFCVGSLRLYFERSNIYSVRSDVQSWEQLLQSKRRPPSTILPLRFRYLTHPTFLILSPK